MKKFKHWLIRKLGGCLPDRKEIWLTKTVVKPVKVFAEHEEFGFAELKRRFPAYDVDEYVKAALARGIAEQLSLRGLWEVKQSYDTFTDTTRFIASIEVIPQERSKGE
ncbi:MAG: hypothetical protein J6S14_10970 [Clostridia bacterium]|nr:hypothetical protein [Clostridia bacterium]